MSKLLQAKIDVTKIDKNLLFKGQKGTYLDVLIWINDTPDKYGNDCSIEQKVKMGEKKNYIGNGKFYHPKPEQVIDPNDQEPQSDMPF
jgi:hypothetical protein